MTDFFGLDVGSRLLKLVQLRPAKESGFFDLLTVGVADTPNRGLLSDSEADLTELAITIKKLIKDLQVTGNNLVAALPQERVFTQVIKLPAIKEEEIPSALQWQAEQYVPFPLNEVTLSHEVLNHRGGTDAGFDVLLVAAPTRFIDKVVNLARLSGLNLMSLETDAFSLVRSLINVDPTPALVLDFGSHATNILAVNQGRLVYTRSFPNGGETFTQAVANALDLPPDQAESYKNTYGFDPTKLEGKVKKALDPVLALIFTEIDKTIQYQSTLPYLAKPVRLVLTGGVSLLPEIASRLTAQFGLEVQNGNPFTRVRSGDNATLAKLGTDQTLFSVAVGLAMKSWM